MEKKEKNKGEDTKGENQERGEEFRSGEYYEGAEEGAESEEASEDIISSGSMGNTTSFFNPEGIIMLLVAVVIDLFALILTIIV